MPRKTDIDEIDAKILKALLSESRTSFTEIAKDCKISIVAVRMRYKHLWKTGIIAGEIMQVNPHSLGYKCIAAIGIVTAVYNEEKVLEFLKNKSYVLHIIRNFGKYDLAVIVTLSDMQELSAILEDLGSNHLFIEHVDAMIWAEAINMDYTENLIIKPFTNKQNSQSNRYSINHEETQIDETDQKIAKILSQNSRRPFKKIAEEIGISTQNVILRYKRLRETVLTLSTIQVDLNKLGYRATAHVLVKIANRSKTKEIYAQMLQIPNLIVAIRLIGPYDLFVIVALEDFESLFSFKENILRISGIEEIDISINPSFPSWPLNLFSSLLE